MVDKFKINKEVKSFATLLCLVVLMLISIEAVSIVMGKTSRSGKTVAVIGEGYSETWNNVDVQISSKGDLTLTGKGFEVRYTAGQWSRATMVDYDPHAVNAIKAKEEK